VQDWDIAEARAAYSIAHWGSRYFDIGAEGHLQVTPRPGRDETRIDLHRVTDHLEANGLSLPVLVRFTDILQDRVHQLREAFTRAMSDSEYLGGYAPVYPIKVNQQRRVVEAIFGSGDVGLETGSKPELMAVLGLATHDTLIVCNGYKDREYVRLALIGEQLGLGVTPRLGVRLQLASTGRGKWENSGGERSKFGLPASDVLQVVERLRAEGMNDALQLMHVHLGSQIGNIRDIHQGEYANGVVHAVASVCEQESLPHPLLITESGRALTAHHAVLVTNIVDVTRSFDDVTPPPPEEDAPKVLHDLWGSLQQVEHGSLLEVYHDTGYWLAEAQAMYNHGVLDLAERSLAERLANAIRARLVQLLNPSVPAHREALDDLTDILADKYFCNLSIFQSLPDVWAIDQVFPVMPLQRLAERPTRRAVLHDITCDSDGLIEQYVNADGVDSTLQLHAPRQGEPYRLGIFLVGAYQEILGDLHNLFGDTHSVNVELDGKGGYRLALTHRCGGPGPGPIRRIPQDALRGTRGLHLPRGLAGSPQPLRRSRIVETALPASCARAASARSRLANGPSRTRW
jgi:arginine decarboxylase